MNRRRFISVGCGCLLSAAANLAWGWQSPARFARPSLTSDEGGLWSMMDREESRFRRSPFVLRDRKLVDYIQAIACRLAADHCPDIRVYLVRTPLFNANIAPNGMSQIWTGLLLRMENEAQLAAVIGHEIAHYLQRHSLGRLRDAKVRTAFSQFLGIFGTPGTVAQLAIIASMLAYSRDQERDADAIGVSLMRKAGYDPAEAAKVWSNLVLELKARPAFDLSQMPLFATHPPAEERQNSLAELAAESGGGETNEIVWRENVKPFVGEWLREEVARGQHEQSIALLTRSVTRWPADPDFRYARGEVYRLRSERGDFDLALADYSAAAELGGEPPGTHRGMGLIYRARDQRAEARACFERYLYLAAGAPDASMIRSYLEDLGT